MSHDSGGAGGGKGSGQNQGTNNRPYHGQPPPVGLGLPQPRSRLFQSGATAGQQGSGQGNATDWNTGLLLL